MVDLVDGNPKRVRRVYRVCISVLMMRQSGAWASMARDPWWEEVFGTQQAKMSGSISSAIAATARSAVY